MAASSRYKKPLLGFFIFSLISFEIFCLTLYFVAHRPSLERSLAITLSILEFLLILKYLVKKHQESGQKQMTKIGPIIKVKKYEIEAAAPLPPTQCNRNICKYFIFTGITCLILTTLVILCLFHPLTYQSETSLFLSTNQVVRSSGLDSYEGWAVILELEACIVGAAIALINLTWLIYKFATHIATRSKRNKRNQASKIKSATQKEQHSRSLSSKFLVEQSPQTADQTVSSFNQKKKHSSTESLVTVKRKKSEKLFKIPELSEKEEQNTNYSKSRRKFYAQILNPNISFMQSCFLCLNRFNSQDMVYKIKGCSHHFHLRCISEWDRKFLPMRDFCPECQQKRKN